MSVFERYFPFKHGVCVLFRYRKPVIVGSWIMPSMARIFRRRIFITLVIHGKSANSMKIFYTIQSLYCTKQTHFREDNIHTLKMNISYAVSVTFILISSSHILAKFSDRYITLRSFSLKYCM
jgi:hypothetical protein